MSCDSRAMGWSDLRAERGHRKRAACASVPPPVPRPSSAAALPPAHTPKQKQEHKAVVDQGSENKITSFISKKCRAGEAT